MIERNNMREVVKWGGHLLSISRKASCIHCGNLPSYHSLLSFLICIRVSSCGHGDRHRCGGALPLSEFRRLSPLPVTFAVRGRIFAVTPSYRLPEGSVPGSQSDSGRHIDHLLLLGNNNVSHIEMKSSATPYCFALR